MYKITQQAFEKQGRTGCRSRLWRFTRHGDEVSPVRPNVGLWYVRVLQGKPVTCRVCPFIRGDNQDSHANDNSDDTINIYNRIHNTCGDDSDQSTRGGAQRRRARVHASVTRPFSGEWQDTQKRSTEATTHRIFCPLRRMSSCEVKPQQKALEEKQADKAGSTFAAAGTDLSRPQENLGGQSRPAAPLSAQTSMRTPVSPCPLFPSPALLPPLAPAPGLPSRMPAPITAARMTPCPTRLAV